MIQTRLALAASLMLLLAFAVPAWAQDAVLRQCDAVPAATPPLTAEGVARRVQRAPTATETLAAANNAARQSPDRTNFVQARQIYTYAPGAIYELYANPSFISTVLLEPGETLTDVAAGDTSRWMVTETTAESEVDGRTLVLVKPQATGLRTNIVLVTDRRTYTIEAIAQVGSAYSAQIAWCYPENDAASGIAPSVEDLNFAYRIRTTRGRRPSWLPTRVFDDGRRTWIEMPESVAATDLPPLFVITPEGAELVNYRVQGQRYMVDRVFDAAELRLGTRDPIIVRIEREGLERSGPSRRGARP